MIHLMIKLLCLEKFSIKVFPGNGEIFRNFQQIKYIDKLNIQASSNEAQQ